MKEQQKGKKINPQSIQKMPVRGTQLYTQNIFWMHLKPERFVSDNQHKNNGWYQVKRMKAGQNI